MGLLPEELVLTALYEARALKARLAELDAAIAELRAEPEIDLSAWTKKFKAIAANAAARDAALQEFDQRVRDLKEEIEAYKAPQDAAIAAARAAALEEIARARSAFQSTLENLDVDLANLRSARDALRAGLNAETQARVDAILAEAAARGAALVAERLLWQDADANLAGQLTVIASTADNAIALVVAEQTARANADAALAAAIEYVEATINDPVTGLANSHARVTAEALARATGDEALAASIDSVEATINDPVTGLANSHARITAEQTARADADTALANATSAVEATINNATTGLAAAHARVTAEETARATADSAIAASVTAVEATINNATTGLAAAHARVTAEELARAGADGALAGAIDTIEAVVYHATSGLASAHARITSEELTRAGADSALASGIDTVEATINNPTTGLANAHARITTEETARATADTALGTRATNLESTVNNATTGLAATVARVGTIETTYATQTFAVAKREEAISAAAADATSKVATEASARASADAALADRATNLEASVNTASTGLLARVTTIETTYATDTDALAMKNEAISAAAADATAKVAAEAVARAGVDGYLASKYTLQVTAGNVVTGMVLTSVSDNGTPTSDITFKAANFKVITDVAGVTVTPFEISGGTVKMSGGFIVDGTITAAKIESTLSWSKNFVVGTGGNIRQGKANYADTAAGFFLGDSSGSKFHVGNTNSWLKWTGSEVEIRGTLSLLAGGAGVDYTEVRPGLIKQGKAKIESFGGGTSTYLTVESGDGSLVQVRGHVSAVPATLHLQNNTDGITLSMSADGSMVLKTLSVTAPANSSVRNITHSTSDPSGGIDGDVWLKYAP